MWKSISLFGVLCVLLCAGEAPLYLFYPNSQAQCVSKAPAVRPLGRKLNLLAPKDGASVELHTPVQQAYLQMPRAERIAFFADAAKRMSLINGGGYWPQDVTLQWEYAPLVYYNACCFAVYVSENENMDNAVRVVVPPRRRSIALNNLKAATTYYWMVEVERVEGQHVYSTVQHFTTTASVPRLLYIPGVPNSRDLGGYIGKDGRRVRQGRIYRTAGMNNNAGNAYMSAADVAKNMPYLVAVKEGILKEIQQSKAELTSKQWAEYLDIPLSNTWYVYRAKADMWKLEKQYEFLQMKTRPAEFLGCKAEKMTGQGCLHFGKPVLGQWAFLCQEFVAEKDGVISLGGGADWFWAVYVNDTPVFDCMQAGNGTSELSAENHVMDVKVRKGTNLIKVVVGSGTADWIWYWRVNNQGAIRKDGLKRQVKRLEAMRRSCEKIPAGKVKGANRLNETNRGYVTKSLGVKTDIDLRSADECFGMQGSPAGKSVQWVHISSSSYKGMSSENGRKAFTQVFKVFLEEKNYPIVFHCIAGQDRTGAVAFILEALLGVPEEQLWLDWESTGFWNYSVRFAHKNLFLKLLTVFEAYPGATIHEKVRNYVLSLGFTEKDIEKFQELMLEKKPAAK